MPELGVEIRDAGRLAPDKLIEFAPGAWPDRPPQEVLGRWWVRSDFARVKVAIDTSNDRIAAICVGVPSQWRLPDGDAHDAISICGWYVHKDYAGGGLGRALVRAFEADTPYLNTFSISEAAVHGFARMGWVGPYKSRLRLLPVPALRRWRGRDEVQLKTFAASASNLPHELAAALDRIDAGKPAGQLRRVRDANDWTKRLKAYPERAYAFHLLEAEGGTVGYFVTRSTDSEAGRQYRAARLHHVTDAVFNTDNRAIIGAAFSRLPSAVPVSAGALLLCTTSKLIGDVASERGWLDERSRVLGRRLAEKAPLFMLGGRFVDLAGGDVRLTFADSDLDLNI